ncbi:MAG: hypothetical protein ACKVUS_15620 [Saprospiraceae bacterium]
MKKTKIIASKWATADNLLCLLGDLMLQDLSRQVNANNIKRYDSTMIAVFSHLLEGMKVGNTSKKKNQVKLTTELLGDFEVRMRFFKDQDHLGEEAALKEMIQSQMHEAVSQV